MKTYLFKVAKINNSILSDNKYRTYDESFIKNHPLRETESPFIARSIKVNSYLIDLKFENIELIRFIGNTLIQAESGLFENETFLYCLVYELELGKGIDNSTPSTLLLNLRTSTSRTGWYYQTSAINENGEIKLAKMDWNVPRAERHRLRGSGRYKAVYIKDSPLHFEQYFLSLDNQLSRTISGKDDFIGLEIAFARSQGKAQKFIYMGAVSKNNYYIDAVGNIVLHRKGNLYKNGFNNYRKCMSIIWPLMSKNILNKDGILVESAKIVDNGFPNLVTEFKAQRRSSYTKRGSSEIFKAQLIKLMQDYGRHLTWMLNDIQYWCHNLNYSVGGLQSSENVYLKAERILKLISSYFPTELTLGQTSTRTKVFESDLDVESHLVIKESRKTEVAECWDRLVLLCDWMRRNFVDYTPKEPLSDYINNKEGREATYIRQDQGTELRHFTTEVNAPFPTLEHANYMVNQNYVSEYGDVFEVVSFVESRPVQLYWRGYTLYTYNCMRYRMVMDIKPAHGWEVRIEWSEYNQWLERTSEIAADIEKVYLSFQFNAVNFLELLAHLITILDSEPRQATRMAGSLPGEIIRTRRQNLNRYRVVKESDARRVDNRPDNDLKDIQAPTTPMPTFTPLQIDARGIVKRCAKDNTQQDEDESREYEIERERQRSEADRREFKAQQDEIERRKLKAEKRPRFRWRNEIDGLTQTEQLNERISLYNEIAGNLNTAVDAFDVVTTGIELFQSAVAPVASPLFVGQHFVKKAGTGATKRAIRKIVEELAEVELPELPEFDDYEESIEIESPQFTTPGPQGEVPRPRVRHKYKPPKTDDTPEFTGDEPDGREWDECHPAETCYGGMYGEYGVVTRPAQANGVDKQVVESYEPGGFRELVQKGLKYFDDVADMAECCGDIPEENPQDRYRCIRAAARVPRE